MEASTNFHRLELPQSRSVEVAINFHESPPTSVISTSSHRLGTFSRKCMWKKRFTFFHGSLFTSIGRLFTSTWKCFYTSMAVKFTSMGIILNSMELSTSLVPDWRVSGGSCGGFKLQYVCTVWMGSGCRMRRAHCGVNVPRGNRAVDTLVQYLMTADSVEAYTILWK